jgi:F-type H+-transporting ATPase subunit alpha
MTNIMGTTDGHLQFSSDLFAQGTFPPIVEDESVTRVGKHAHTMVQKQLSTTVTTLLAEAKAQERFTQFSSQVSEATKSVLVTGSIIRTLLNQAVSVRLAPETQAILLALPLTTFVNNKDTSFFKMNMEKLSTYIAGKECDDLRVLVQQEQDFTAFIQAVEKKGPAFEKACHK